MNKLGVKFAFGAAAPRGSELDDLERDFAARCAAAAKQLEEKSAVAEGYGWMALPEADISDAVEAARWLYSYDSIIHVGIGGSALGNLMLNQALLDRDYNEQWRDDRGGPMFYLADNPDPSKAAAIWRRVTGTRTALVGVSKSGATAETMSQFLWFREQMANEFPESDVNKDTLVITDPEKGIFRAFARETGCRSLPLPPSVGGRYSVLSNAGLASAAALGIEVTGLLRGAKEMKDYLLGEIRFKENAARVIAACNIMHESCGRSMAVMMPYSSRLEYFAEWFAQLWGESLGKDGTGTTPVRALGAIDQHSQVQLYTQGPDDKFYTLINVLDHGEEVVIPRAGESSLQPLSYMSGAEIGDMLKLEAASTASALIDAGRPIFWIEQERLDAPAIGALVFFYEYMTALTGLVKKIDPFDQPGVERGKRYTYGLMGMKEFEGYATEAKTHFHSIETLVKEL